MSEKIAKLDKLPPALVTDAQEDARKRAEEIIEKTQPLWRRAEDIALHVEDLLIKQLGMNVTAETLRVRVTELRASLVEPGDTELETMMVVRVVACWLALNDAEKRRARLWEKSSVDHKNAEFWDRRVSRMHGDYLKACKALAQVRKLRRPVVQVNIADKQINTVGPMNVGLDGPGVQANNQLDEGETFPELEEDETRQDEDD